MNQNPEQLARDEIDHQLIAYGWILQNKSCIYLHSGPGIAVREYLTDVGPADYVLFVNSGSRALSCLVRRKMKLLSTQ